MQQNTSLKYTYIYREKEEGRDIRSKKKAKRRANLGMYGIIKLRMFEKNGSQSMKYRYKAHAASKSPTHIHTYLRTIHYIHTYIHISMYKVHNRGRKRTRASRCCLQNWCAREYIPQKASLAVCQLKSFALSCSLPSIPCFLSPKSYIFSFSSSYFLRSSI